MRLLRSYRRTAEVEHWCDRCCDIIFPGEAYEADVYATRTGGRRGIVVMRQHADPPCEPPDEPDRDDDDEDEDSLFGLPFAGEGEEPVPQAA